MSSLYKLCENVAEIDILLALAQVRIVHILMEQKHYNSYLLTSYMFQASMVGSYIRPEFNSYLEIRNSVHPLLDYNSHVMPVPNDVVRNARNKIIELKTSSFTFINYLQSISFTFIECQPRIQFHYNHRSEYGRQKCLYKTDCYYACYGASELRIIIQLSQLHE